MGGKPDLEPRSGGSAQRLPRPALGVSESGYPLSEPLDVVIRADDARTDMGRSGGHGLTVTVNLRSAPLSRSRYTEASPIHEPFLDDPGKAGAAASHGVTLG